jgi:hypothetical protein
MRILIWTNVGHIGVLNIFTIYALATRTTVTSLTDDTVVDSVDTLPNDIFTQYWDVLEEEQDETGFK